MSGGSAVQLKPYQFKPGQVGNPTGMGGERTEVMRLARSFCREAIDRLVTIMREGKESNQILAAVAILNRGLGTPPQQIEVSGEMRKFVIELPLKPASKEEWIQTLPIPKAIEAK